MMKRTLALIALLTFFSPFLAAQGRFEIVTAVEEIVGDPAPVSLKIQVRPGTPPIFIYIRVAGLDFTGIDFTGNVLLEGIFTLDGARATDIAPGGVESTKNLTGRIETISNRVVTLFGGWVISVPEGAELKDKYGDTQPLEEFEAGVDFIKAEGEILAGWFTASEMKIVEEFVCPGDAKPTHTSFLEPELYEDHEDFCLQKKGGRQGRTRITMTDYVDEDSAITVGRYTQNQRHGLWITLSESGAPRRECFYHQDEFLFGLLDGNESNCAFTPIPE